MKIIGHTSEREHLARIVAASLPPQSFLFSGPRQLGKFCVALEFARHLVGMEQETGDLTDRVLILGRQSESSEAIEKVGGLSAADIRRAESFLSRFPVAGRYRVVIIDDADQLTHSAANALLKILEEPNSTSMIILVTHLPGRLLPTVRSRLYHVVFAPLSAKELRSALSDSEVPDFFYSLGLPGLIVGATQYPVDFSRLKDNLRSLFQLTRLQWSERLSLAEKLANGEDDLSDVMEKWITGLSRQRSPQMAQSVAFALFLESALETLDRVSRKEGNPRLLLEKLFTQV